MNTILAANAVASTTTNYAGGYGGNAVRTGASVVPASKAFNQNVAAVFASEQKPVTRVRIAEQGSTTDFLVVAHYGPCVEQPDHHDQPVLQPYAGAAFRDDFDLPIAGHPAPGQAGNMFQNAPGNSFNLGILSTSPPGVTSPAIPNTGDVTPGTAGANPAAYTSAPLKKQHPWITDMVTGHGLMQTAYGKYDYKDPTGSVHTSLGKGDTHVKKPLLDVKLSTNLTPPFTGMTPIAGLTPTQYADNAMEFSLVADGGNDGIRSRVDDVTVGINANNQLYVIASAGGSNPFNLRPGTAIGFDPSFPPSLPPVLVLNLVNQPGVDVGGHKYAYRYTYTVAGVTRRTPIGPAATVTTDATHATVGITIPALDAGSPGTAVDVFRTKADDTIFYFLASSTPGGTLTDSAADSTLTTAYTADPIVINALYDSQSVFLNSDNQLSSWRAGDALEERPGPAPLLAPPATLNTINQPLVDAGLHTYAYCYTITRHGITVRTALSPTTDVTTDATHASVSFTTPAAPTDSPVTGLELYRTIVGDTVMHLVTAAPNIDMASPFTYTDSATDAVVGAAAVYSAAPPTLNVQYDSASIKRGVGNKLSVPGQVVQGQEGINVLTESAAAHALSFSVGAGAGLGKGWYGYVFSYWDATHSKDSTPSKPAAVHTTTGNQQVNLTTVAPRLLTDAQETRIYRTMANGTEYGLLTTLAAGITTYLDTTPDSSLTMGTTPSINVEDITVRLSGVLVAPSDGPSSTSTMIGYTVPQYNDSGLMFTGVKGLKVNIDGTTITRRASDGALQAASGGGSTVALNISQDLLTTVDPIPSGTTGALITWHTGGNIQVDHGGWVSAGTDLTGPHIVIPTTGTYMIALQTYWQLFAADTGETEYHLLQNGSEFANRLCNVDTTNFSHFTMPFTTMWDFVAGDVLTIKVTLGFDTSMSMNDGTISIWEV